MKYLLILLVGFLSACGDSNGGKEPALGGVGSLHEGIESLMMHELSTLDKRQNVFDVTPINVESIPDTTEGNREVQYSLRDQNPDYSMFDAYPNKTYSARTYRSILFATRNSCLNECIKDTSCGSVTFIPSLHFCRIHGPNMPWYTFGEGLVHSGSGLTTVDTYIYRDRKGDPGVKLRYSMGGSFGKHGLSAGSTIYVKFLYSDKTASEWIPYQHFSYSPNKFSHFGSEQPFYFKHAEAFVFSTDSKHLSSVQVIKGGMSSVQMDQLDDQAYLAQNLFFILSNFSIDDSYSGITLDPNCDGGSSDKCTNVIVMPTERDPQQQVDILQAEGAYTTIKNYRNKFAY